MFVKFFRQLVFHATTSDFGDTLHHLYIMLVLIVVNPQLYIMLVFAGNIFNIIACSQAQAELVR